MQKDAKRRRAASVTLFCIFKIISSRYALFRFIAILLFSRISPVNQRQHARADVRADDRADIRDMNLRIGETFADLIAPSGLSA